MGNSTTRPSNINPVPPTPLTSSGDGPPNPYRMLDAALELAALGWSIIPLCHPEHPPGTTEYHKRNCKRKGKQPVVKWTDRQKRAFTADELRNCWHKCRLFNVGVVTGMVSRMVMIDVDGPVGEAELRLIPELRDVKTWEFSTGREEGGRHLVFAWPHAETPMGNRLKGLATKIDFLGEGHESVLPPSIHKSGVEYRWTKGGPGSGMPLAVMPLQLSSDGGRKTEQSREPGGGGSKAQAEPPLDRRRQVKRGIGFAQGWEPAIQGDNGSDVAFALACRLVHGLSLADDEAFMIMLNHWNERCVPPWSEQELWHKIRDARANGKCDPIPERPYPAPASPAPPTPGPPAAPEIGCLASTLDDKPPRWFFEPWVPKGTLTALCGAKSTGKSTLLAYLCSLVERSIYLVGEEDPRGPLLRRLDRNGVQRGRVRIVQPSREFRLPDQLPHLERQILADGAQLLVCDPLARFFDLSLSENVNDDVASVLYPLMDVAHRTDCTIVAIKHPGKTAGNVMRGAAAWGDIPRAVIQLLLEECPERRMITHWKNNEAGGIAAPRYFDLVGKGDEARLFVLGDLVNQKDAQMAAEATDKIESLKVEDAMEFLRGVLAEGKMEATAVYKLADSEKFKESTIFRASVRLGVVKKREGTAKAHRSMWWLPAQTGKEGVSE